MKFAILPLFIFPLFAAAVPSERYIQKNALQLRNDISLEVAALLSKHKVIAIGEHHGNDKTPLIAGKIALALSQKDEVILALEIQKANQLGLDEYLKTGDKYLLKLLAHFAREYQDGRSSMAIVQLLDMVRKNPKIQIVAFDPDFNSSGQDRDTKMAEYLIEVISKAPQKRVVILAGNVHSATKIGNFFDVNYKPMAYQLSGIPNSSINADDVLSVMTRYEFANIWACVDDKPKNCGPLKLNDDQSAYSTAVPYDSYFLMEPTLSMEGYKASYFVRRVNLSPPFQ
jgi:hypothetical protein